MNELSQLKAELKELQGKKIIWAKRKFKKKLKKFYLEEDVDKILKKLR